MSISMKIRILANETSVEAKLDAFVEERTASLPPSRKNGNTGRYIFEY